MEEAFMREKGKVMQAVTLLTILLSLFVLMKTVSEFRAYKFIGADAGPDKTITVSGQGEVYAPADIATLSISVEAEKLKQADAKDELAETMNPIIEFLKKEGIAEKDIKSGSISLHPKYEYREERIVCITYPCPQPPGRQILTGYVVSQTLEVKVRDLDAVGKIFGGVLEMGATNVYGPNFTIEDEDAIKEKAREIAITEAKEKAERLAKDLGVSLVGVVSFSESGDYPIFYGRASLDMAGAPEAQKAIPEVPVGENKITSNVSIVYQIR